MISDIVKADLDFLEAFEDLNIELKGIVEFYNLSFRGSNFLI